MSRQHKSDDMEAALKVIHKDPVVAALLTIHSDLEVLRGIAEHQTKAIQGLRNAIVDPKKGRG